MCFFDPRETGGGDDKAGDITAHTPTSLQSRFDPTLLPRDDREENGTPAPFVDMQGEFL